LLTNKYLIFDKEQPEDIYKLITLLVVLKVIETKIFMKIIKKL